MNKIIFLGIITVFLFSSHLVIADIGVGVGTGKIEFDEALKPGLSYNLPDLTVINTGSEASDYSVSIGYRDGVPELRPDESWFTFSPEVFYLEPGENKQIKINLSLPVRGVEPGDYFAFVKAHPVQEAQTGVTEIGVAAAAKLYFTVEPANLFQGLYYRFGDWYGRYHPWNTIVLVVLLIAVLIVTFRHKFKIEIAKK